VIGGSAGSIQALTALVAALPRDLPAAVCVVLHLSPLAPSSLADILTRVGPLRAVPATQGARLQPGVIYTAVPDMHLLVESDTGISAGVIENGMRSTNAPGRLRIVRGPKENRSRPAVDPLFRSAALAYGPRVIGVVLSGALDDGTAGLWAIKDQGGIAVVQDPEDAAVSSMPANALLEVGADHVATADALGTLLAQLSRTPVDNHTRTSNGSTGTALDDLEREVAIATVDEETHRGRARYGVPSRFACPDCGGVLWDVTGTGPLRFRCETGHAFSSAYLSEAQVEGVETAFWAALRALEDKIELARRRAERAEQQGLHSLANTFTVQAEAAQQHAAALQIVLRMDGRSGISPHTADYSERVGNTGNSLKDTNSV
jgi:two-component system chemotaxis response regulator CheB